VQREGPEKALMVHYLLNELSSAERKQIEQRCFQDPDSFDALRPSRRNSSTIMRAAR
jgi:hypothetical protein